VKLVRTAACVPQVSLLLVDLGKYCAEYPDRASTDHRFVMEFLTVILTSMRSKLFWKNPKRHMNYAKTFINMNSSLEL